jgi:hypothetical protein
MAIQQSGGFRFKLHEDPSVEGGPFGRLLISHGESVREFVRSIQGGDSFHSVGRVVAHTAALPHHAWNRAQKSAQFSMVSTVYTLSMGTYWVRSSTE